MKIDPVMLLVSLAVSALIAFGFYTANQGEAYRWLITMGSAFLCCVTLSGILAVSFDVRGGTGNYKIVSALFFIITLTSNIVFDFLNFTVASYVIINGILFLLFIMIEYSIIKALR
ncbi:MAG: hypothetical protein LBP71_01045 [Spirochaetaceae bacterium]|jgi:hypothetical protein|nr:hypothetical protein [Spirochaetaceae bacterium]